MFSVVKFWQYFIKEWRDEMKKSREAPAKKKIKAKADKDFFKDTDIVK